jgi:RimJ/RimL family protein N-acetyltransferase
MKVLTSGGTEIPWLDGDKGMIGYWVASGLRGRGLASNARRVRQWATGLSAPAG